MVYYILLDSYNKQNGYCVTEGLNEYPESYDGSYVVFDEKNIFNSADDYDQIAEIVFDDSAKIIHSTTETKPIVKYIRTDKIIVSKILRLTDFFLANPDKRINAVNSNGLCLKHITDQTKYICIRAVRNNGLALEFVKNQTADDYMEISIKALKNDGTALKFIEDQTNEQCLVAVNQIGFALKYVKNQTPDVCIKAITQKITALCFVKTHTPELCVEALKHSLQLHNLGACFQYADKNWFGPGICLEIAYISSRNNDLWSPDGYPVIHRI
jgi:hypothetical protein